MRRLFAILLGLSASAYAVAQDPAARIRSTIMLSAPLEPAAKSTQDDDLPPRAAKIKLASSEIQRVSGEAVQNSQVAPAPTPRGLRGPELFDYLSEGRYAKSEERKREPKYDAPSDESERGLSGLGARWGKIFDRPSEALFLSDHEFESFISPVTNPFLFEDPRSLTEVRTIFIYQKVPGVQNDFQGGNIWFAGAQARVAITKQFSFTFNKIGIVGTNPGSASLLDSKTGLSELWFGPKYTFIRDPKDNLLVAGGLQFQVPVGSDKVYQDTGKLTLLPYASIAKGLSFGTVGCFNTLASSGYAFSTNKDRSDYFYASGHISWDVMNKQKFFPLAELNWIHYTTNGTASSLTGEGRDLINFGSSAKGTGLLTGALGARYRFSKHLEAGAAYEMPFAGNRDYFRYRFTVDLIFRY